ncbi:TAP-like protein [Luteibacter rhizovicinus]|uniref:TAP-like protein n=1 Tax=Luteibacter rhizovicinus TaxID=242606 RepID=A0A4R3YYZ8_9GAMM|nr:alpha/beta hydrolase [Luteibacter rhizovicinus]TCV97782.1 TAP-like protein [Luteibacter rhizovicinus]
MLSFNRMFCLPLAFAYFLLIPALASAAHKAGDIVVEQRVAIDDKGQSVAYEIGTLYVPENRLNPRSRLIGVGFARIRASASVSSGTPPVFWLPGGPGLTVLGAFTDSDAASKSRLTSWLAFRQASDLVVVEQRGYTLRGDMLTIPLPASPDDRPGSVRADAAAMRAQARAAVAAYPDKDLSGYDIGEFASDVDDLRRALGYEKISLFGGSFGSQWALAVMRLHPGIVSRAVLASVEPLDNGYDMPSHVYAALQRIAYDADRDPQLVPYMPPGGLMAAVRIIHERFAAAPVTVAITEDNGTTRNLVLGAEDLQLALLSHTQESAEWPAFILSIYHRHYEAWARDVAKDRQAGTTILIGPLSDSSLGVSPEREHLLRTDPALDLLGEWNFEGNIASAPDWPTRDMGDAVRLPKTVDIPVIFIHGDWDTSTPIENTLGLLPYFPNGHAILVHRGSHDGAFYQLRNEPAAKQAVYGFLRSGDTKGLPVQIVLPIPRFDVPAFAPPPKTT